MGPASPETFKESSQAGSDYLAEVCKGWEKEAQKANVSRVVIIRTGEQASRSQLKLAPILIRHAVALVYTD